MSEEEVREAESEELSTSTDKPAATDARLCAAAEESRTGVVSEALPLFAPNAAPVDVECEA